MPTNYVLLLKLLLVIQANLTIFWYNKTTTVHITANVMGMGLNLHTTHM